MTGVNADKQKMVIGVASVVVFAISVLLQVKWKEKAETMPKLFNSYLNCYKNAD